MAQDIQRTNQIEKQIMETTKQIECGECNGPVGKKKNTTPQKHCNDDKIWVYQNENVQTLQVEVVDTESKQ